MEIIVDDINDKSLEKYLKKLHSEILDIAIFFHNLCNSYKLKYYIVGGSLLGAARHKGFIPWDDDFDVAMPNKDFKKLLSIFNNNKFENYECLSCYNTNNYFNGLSKIHKKNTLFLEQDFTGSLHHGISIDIFPLETSNLSKIKLKLKKKYKIYAMRLYESKFYNMAHKKKFATIISNLCPKKIAKIIYDKSIKINSNEKGEYYANFYSQYPILNQTFPKKYYGKGMSLCFENFEFTAPLNYHKILSSIYGDKYMKIPNKEKRRIHYPRKVVFSDKTEVNFIYKIKRIGALESL